jgi:hypothetical protein
MFPSAGETKRLDAAVTVSSGSLAVRKLFKPTGKLV